MIVFYEMQDLFLRKFNSYKDSNSNSKEQKEQKEKEQQAEPSKRLRIR